LRARGAARPPRPHLHPLVGEALDVLGGEDRAVDWRALHETLKDEAELVADQVYDLGRAVERALRRHGKNGTNCLSETYLL